jgi:serine/threonine protein kinase
MEESRTMQDTDPSAARGQERPPPEIPFSDTFKFQYEPERFLGQGAMGAVFLMKQRSLDRLVAVKVLRTELAAPEEVRRLIKEAKVLARLQHPAIIGVHDVGFDGELPYMVCEYVDGESLGGRLKRERMPLRQIVALTCDLLDGLGAAHAEGVVHRDLKPDNIFLTTTGRAKIGDFGLARAAGLSSGTSIGFLVGTPEYMSPEQCRGELTTPESDLYSMGVTLYRMLTGELPFKGPDLPAFLYQHCTTPPAPPSALEPKVSGALDEVVLRMLAKDPKARYANAADAIAALRAVPMPENDRPSLRPVPVSASISTAPVGLVSTLETPASSGTDWLSTLALPLGAVMLTMAIMQSSGVKQTGPGGSAPAAAIAAPGAAAPMGAQPGEQPESNPGYSGAGEPLPIDRSVFGSERQPEQRRSWNTQPGIVRTASQPRASAPAYSGGGGQWQSRASYASGNAARVEQLVNTAVQQFNSKNYNAAKATFAQAEAIDSRLAHQLKESKSRGGR